MSIKHFTFEITTKPAELAELETELGNKILSINTTFKSLSLGFWCSHNMLGQNEGQCGLLNNL